MTIVDDAHRAFVDAVTRQLTRPPGVTAAAPAARPAHETMVRSTLDHLLAAAAAAPDTASFTAAAKALRADEALLSSVFQNLDMFGVEDPIGVGVALLVAAALEE